MTHGNYCSLNFCTFCAFLLVFRVSPSLFFAILPLTVFVSEELADHICIHAVVTIHRRLWLTARLETIVTWEFFCQCSFEKRTSCLVCIIMILSIGQQIGGDDELISWMTAQRRVLMGRNEKRGRRMVRNQGCAKATFSLDCSRILHFFLPYFFSFSDIF